ncbi:MAG: tetratricopeptide repeat protein [Planctomycetes bacterium]|nr:tetratricopeptide repeat protein [Planctomycetota bacterium]
MAVQQRRPEELQTALQRADELLTRSDVDAHVLEGAYRARTLVLLALDRADEAAQTLDRRATDERLGGGLAPSDGLALLRARVLMSRHTSETYQQAIELLEPLTRREGLERRFVGQASYLVAQCHEQLGRLAAQDGHSETASGHFDAAINRYARTADGQPDSDDGLASWVRSAALLREAGREEEALSAYRQAFARIEQPEEFHSLWLTLADLEQEALRARADWIERKRFDEAIALTEALAGLLGRLKASELVAEASTRRAQWLEEELQTLPPPERAARQDDVRQAWQTGGAAWADYAAQIATTSEYGEALWTSADHFDRGHNFERARQQLAAFLATNPQRRLAPATVRMGRLLLDLDRPEEAFFWFRQAIEQHPSDVAAIEAEYLLGRCHIEREDFKAAQQTWQNVLESENLTPDAREWRLSLFSLGRLQYSRAVLDERAAASAPPDERETFEESAHKRREECTRLLDEFAARYPADERAFEARYLAARARTLQSHGPRDRLDAAETEAARRRLENERRALLEAALAQYLSLERDLDGRDTDRGLGPLDERLLRGCWFHAAEALYELGRYDEAIERYAAAADRFPHDPGVLTAYLRISQCHERQGRFAEARSLLEQTRVIHEGLPDSAFDSSITSLTRSDWKDWIEWSREFAPQP